MSAARMRRLLACWTFRSRFSRFCVTAATRVCTSPNPKPSPTTIVNHPHSTQQPFPSQFVHLINHSPCFPVSASNIHIIHEPCDFYAALKRNVKSAKTRIVLSSLYLNTGTYEQDLIDAVYKNCESAQRENRNVEITFLFDYFRGSRGVSNTRTICHKLIRDFPDTVQVYLYHSPDLRGLLKAVTPDRFNEVVGVTHLKVYLFDDTLIMSGICPCCHAGSQDQVRVCKPGKNPMNGRSSLGANSQPKCLLIDGVLTTKASAHSLVQCNCVLYVPNYANNILLNYFDITSHFSANLDDKYFTQRQDRYISIRDNSLANFFSDLIKTVSKFSLQLQPDDTLVGDTQFGVHPVTGNFTVKWDVVGTRNEPGEIRTFTRAI